MHKRLFYRQDDGTWIQNTISDKESRDAVDSGEEGNLCKEAYST